MIVMVVTTEAVVLKTMKKVASDWSMHEYIDVSICTWFVFVRVVVRFTFIINQYTVIYKRLQKIVYIKIVINVHVYSVVKSILLYLSFIFLAITDGIS